MENSSSFISHDVSFAAGVKGFSEANIRFVRRWYLFYSEAFSNSVTSCDRIGQQPVAQLVQIPWGHNRVIISKFLLELGSGFAFIGRQIGLSLRAQGCQMAQR